MAVSTLPTSQYWSVHQSHGCQYTAHFTVLVCASVTWLCQYTAHFTIQVTASVTWLCQYTAHFTILVTASVTWLCQYTAHFTILVSAYQPHSCVGTLPTSQYRSGLRVMGVTVRKTSMGRMPPA